MKSVNIPLKKYIAIEYFISQSKFRTCEFKKSNCLIERRNGNYNKCLKCKNFDCNDNIWNTYTNLMTCYLIETQKYINNKIKDDNYEESK